MITFCTKYVGINEKGHIVIFGGYLEAENWDEAEKKALELGVELDGELVENVELTEEEAKELQYNLFMQDHEWDILNGQ